MAIQTKLKRKWPHTYQSYDWMPVYMRAVPHMETYWAANTKPCIQRIKDTEDRMKDIMHKYSGKVIRCIGAKCDEEGRIVR